MNLYFVSGAENISTIFKREHTALPAEAGIIVSLKNMFAAPRSSLDIFKADNSGMRVCPTSWSTVEKKELRVYHLSFKLTTQLMSGSGLKPLASRFAANLSFMFHEEGINHEWQDLPDICAFIQNSVFRAAVTFLCEPYIFSLNPTFNKNFWKFDKNVIHLLKGYPEWLIPRAYAARERCLRAVANWHQHAIKHCGALGPDSEDEYEPLFGAKFMKARRQCFSKMDEMTNNAQASLDLDVIWAWVELHCFLLDDHIPIFEVPHEPRRFY